MALGMLASTETISTVAKALIEAQESSNTELRVVLDPVSVGCAASPCALTIHTNKLLICCR